MIAYKEFEKDLVCRGYQFTKDKVHETDQANCRENGFHCAENPLDCLCYYRDWKNSVYYLVEASGDLDEDGADTKISCTRLRLLKELDFKRFLLHGVAYMEKHPERPWNQYVQKDTGTSYNGFAIVRGKAPSARGKKQDLLLLLREESDSCQIKEIKLIEVDGVEYQENKWYGMG